MSVEFPHIFPPSHGPASSYGSDMEYPENARHALENLWRTKVEAALLHYSNNHSIETTAAYRSALKTFTDLVLRGKAQRRYRRTLGKIPNPIVL